MTEAAEILRCVAADLRNMPREAFGSLADMIHHVHRQAGRLDGLARALREKPPAATAPKRKPRRPKVLFDKSRRAAAQALFAPVMTRRKAE